MERIQIRNNNHKKERFKFQMIKKFNDFVNEGFWKDGIKRAKNNSTRIDERIISNINEMHSVDLGLKFEIADVDLEVDEEDHINWPTLYKIYNQILEMGWRLPTDDEVGILLDKFDVVAKENNYEEKELYLESKDKSKNINIPLCTLGVEFKNFGEKYWFIPKKGMEEEYDPKNNSDWTRRMLCIHTFYRWGKIQHIYKSHPDQPNTQKCKVRLVRDKN